MSIFRLNSDEKRMSPDRPANGVVVRNREKLFEKWDGILQNFKNQSTPAKGTTGTIKTANKTNGTDKYCFY